MRKLSEALALAAEHHRAGRLAIAGEHYRRILAVEPSQADALHLLGLVQRQFREWGPAIRSLRAAVRANGKVAEYRDSFGEALLQAGEPTEAVEVLGGALQLKPMLAAGYLNLGRAQVRLGKPDSAAENFRTALAIRPEWWEPRFEAALVMRDGGRPAEAEVHFGRLVKLRPDSAEAHNAHGVVLRDLRRFTAAEVSFRRAAELEPSSAPAFGNLGLVMSDLGRSAAAVESLRRALVLNPNYWEAYNNLGMTLADSGHLEEAAEALGRAIGLNPEHATFLNNLGNVLKDAGLIGEAIASYRRAVALQPGYVRAHSNLLMAHLYLPEFAPHTQARIWDEFEHLHGVQLEQVSVTARNSKSRRDRLRLGFVSPDLGRHPVGYLMARFFENFAGRGPERVVYSDRLQSDELTARIRRAVPTWREVQDLSDGQLAELIRADEIDVLFDLAGHSSHNRALVFARKPAPMQVAWAGYPASTGLRSVDYLLADRFTVPTESEPAYREKILRMPDAFVSYDPRPDSPAVSALPSLSEAGFTFGCFNNPAKICPRTVEVWGRILRRLPTAKLVLKYRGMNDRLVSGRLLRLFDEAGIPGTRVEFHGYSPLNQALAAYHRIDLALDPLVFSGGLTTLDSLWMGVPVVTCPGWSFASRQSYSFQTNLGLEEFVAPDPDRYVEIAVGFAQDRRRLAAIRSGLRERMAASAVCDGRRFSENFIRVVEEVWRLHGS